MNKQQAYYEIFKAQIEKGEYYKEEMLFKIDKRTLEGVFDEATRDQLVALVEQYHNPNYAEQETLSEKVALQDSRIDDLEVCIFELAAMIDTLMSGGVA